MASKTTLYYSTLFAACPLSTWLFFYRVLLFQEEFLIREDTNAAILQILWGVNGSGLTFLNATTKFRRVVWEKHINSWRNSRQNRRGRKSRTVCLSFLLASVFFWADSFHVPLVMQTDLLGKQNKTTTESHNKMCFVQCVCTPELQFSAVRTQQGAR